MQSFVAIIAMLLSTSVSAHEASHLTVHGKRTSNEHVQEHVLNHEALTKKQDMFYRMAHMKSTPWDSKPTERAAKCMDLCKLNDYWGSQQASNCVNRPSNLCPIYKTGIASMNVVLTVAECTCKGTSIS